MRWEFHPEALEEYREAVENTFRRILESPER